jgi:hypothetical protein
VRRRACATCGSAEPAIAAALPRGGTVLARTVAGAAVEHLDQVSDRKATVLVDLGGLRISCLVAHSDSVSLMDRLRGQKVRLTVRKTLLGEHHGSAPIAYTLKASLDHETRVALKTAKEPT